MRTGNIVNNCENSEIMSNSKHSGSSDILFIKRIFKKTKRKKGWRLRTREKWLPSLRPKAQRFVFVFVIVLISVFVSFFIAEVKSSKAFNCDDDEAAGAKLKAKPTTSYCYQSF